jgi:transcriptional regulator with XRE-family HTH domain
MTTTPTAPRAELTLAEEVLLKQLPPPNVCREIRDKARVSLRRFAREVGVSHGSIAYYERGGQPRVEVAVRYRCELEKLAAAIGYELPLPAEELTALEKLPSR